MRLARISRTLLLLALPAVLVTCAAAQERVNVQPSQVRGQLQPAQAVAGAQAPVKARANASTPVERPAERKVLGAKRDPFEPLLNRSRPGSAEGENLPPGKGGLQVGTLRIIGIVRGSGGMIAVVANPQQRVYFLREGDKLYDGAVQHITLEAVSFHEFGKDAFGKPLEREVTKRLYPSPGEQQ